jgi:hypothetical protein
MTMKTRLSRPRHFYRFLNKLNPESTSENTLMKARRSDAAGGNAVSLGSRAARALKGA